MITVQEFITTLQEPQPPQAFSQLLQALWYDAKGDWNAAHEIAQSKEGTRTYDRLHAYLHRKEGDNWNANYWYRRAKTTMPTISLDDEWNNLLQAFQNL